MFYSRSSGFLCATFRALAKWNKIRTHFLIITAVKPKGKRCITSPLHSTHTFFLSGENRLFICFPFFFQARSTAPIFANVCDAFPLLPATSIRCAAVLWLSIARSTRNSLIFSTTPSDLPGSQLQENSHSSSSSTAPKKKNRWTDTEEKILVELFGENEDKLRYKAFSSPGWLSIARQLHLRCKEQNVDSNETPQQC